MNKFQNLLVGALSGLVLGIACAFIQAARIYVSGQVIPYGVFLALSLIVVSQLWLARQSQSRLSAIGIAIGWIASTVILGQDFGSFEVVIIDAWWSKVYVFVGAIVIGCASTLPPLRAIARSEDLPVSFTEGMQSQVIEPAKEEPGND